MEAQSRVTDVAALAAVVHCLVCRGAQTDRPNQPGPELVEENQFLAARDGMRAQLIEPRSGRRRAVRGTLTELLADCESLAVPLDCADELAAAADLADEPGAARQRRVGESAGLAAVPEWLAGEFTSAGVLVGA
jgi:glutamate---cysteine ligase / carboxylate-amine ligase